MCTSVGPDQLNITFPKFIKENDTVSIWNFYKSQPNIINNTILPICTNYLDSSLRYARLGVRWHGCSALLLTPGPLHYKITILPSRSKHFLCVCATTVLLADCSYGLLRQPLAHFGLVSILFLLFYAPCVSHTIAQCSHLVQWVS